MSSFGYLIRRTVQTAFTLFVVLSLIFALFRLSPSDPTAYAISPAMSESMRQSMAEQYGLNEPLLTQYLIYLKNYLTFDMGSSYLMNQPVGSILLDRVVNTLILTGTAIFIAFALGTTIGAYAAWRHGSSFDNWVFTTAIVFRSIPNFLWGILLFYVFAVELQWFPLGHMVPVGEIYEGKLDMYLSVDFVHHFVLPAVSLVPFTMGFATLLMRTTTLDVINEEFVVIARAKGLRDRHVFTNHVVRNSLLPIFTVTPFLLGLAITGNILIETIYSWPGIGRTLVNALLKGDYPLAQGAFFLIALIVIVGNFVVDLLYTVLDPRITYG